MGPASPPAFDIGPSIPAEQPANSSSKVNAVDMEAANILTSLAQPPLSPPPSDTILTSSSTAAANGPPVPSIEAKGGSQDQEQPSTSWIHPALAASMNLNKLKADSPGSTGDDIKPGQTLFMRKKVEPKPQPSEEAYWRPPKFKQKNLIAALMTLGMTEEEAKDKLRFYFPEKCGNVCQTGSRYKAPIRPLNRNLTCKGSTKLSAATKTEPIQALNEVEPKRIRLESSSIGKVFQEGALPQAVTRKQDRNARNQRVDCRQLFVLGLPLCSACQRLVDMEPHCLFINIRKVNCYSDGRAFVCGWERSGDDDEKTLTWQAQFLPTSHAFDGCESELWRSDAACYILQNLAKPFRTIVREEIWLLEVIRENQPEMLDRMGIFRGSEANRDLCDVCQTTIFNLHMFCTTCGITVCIACIRERNALKKRNVNGRGLDDYGWPVCPSLDKDEEDWDFHYPQTLELAQLIPDPFPFFLGTLQTLQKCMEEVMEREQVPDHCTCEKFSTESGSEEKTKEGNDIHHGFKCFCLTSNPEKQAAEGEDLIEAYAGVTPVNSNASLLSMGGGVGAPVVINSVSSSTPSKASFLLTSQDDDDDDDDPPPISSIPQNDPQSTSSALPSLVPDDDDEMDPPPFMAPPNHADDDDDDMDPPPIMAPPHLPSSPSESPSSQQNAAPSSNNNNNNNNSNGASSDHHHHLNNNHSNNINNNHVSKPPQQQHNGNSGLVNTQQNITGTAPDGGVVPSQKLRPGMVPAGVAGGLDLNGLDQDNQELMQKEKEEAELLKREEQEKREAERIAKEEARREEVENDPRVSTLCDGNILLLHGRKNLSRRTKTMHPNSLAEFQKYWRKGLPVLISHVDRTGIMTVDEWKDKWSPVLFKLQQIKEDHVLHRGLLIDCVYNCPTRGVTSTQFWNGFMDYRQWRKDALTEKKINLKFKDYPGHATFKEALPEQFEAFCKVLPIPEYSAPQLMKNLPGDRAMFNLVRTLPSNLYIMPDLGPKMYTAYGYINPGAARQDARNQGTTNLHLDISDAVNVMVDVTVPGGGPSTNWHRTVVNNHLRAEGIEPKQMERVNRRWEDAGAIWTLWSPDDSVKLKEWLWEVSEEVDSLEGIDAEVRKSIERMDDPIHDQSVYLNKKLRDRLEAEKGVRGFTFIQMKGDAVFIPAGAAHQVQNLFSCIKLAEDFVSPEGVSHCAAITNEFRYLSLGHVNREDKLQLSNIMYHAVKGALSSIEIAGSKR